MVKVILTEEQEAFLERHLGNVLFSLSANKAKRKAYGKYLADEALINDSIRRLGELDAALGDIPQKFQSVKDLVDAGEFVEAAKSAEELRLQATTTVGEAVSNQRKKATLLNLLKDTPAPPGAFGEEIGVFYRAGRAIRSRISETTPDTGSLDSAETTLKDLRREAAVIRQDVQKRADLSKIVSDANRRCDPILANLTRIISDRAYPPAKQLYEAVHKTITDFDLALQQGQHALVMAQAEAVRELPGQLNILEVRVDAALDRLVRASLDVRSVGKAQTDALVKLGKGNPAALQAAKTLLKSYEADTGDALPNSVGIRDLSEAIAAAVKDLREKQTEAEKLSRNFAVISEQKNSKAAEDPGPVRGRGFGAKRPDRNYENTTGEDVQRGQMAADEAKQKVESLRRSLEVLKRKKELLDALCFGPLSPDNGRAVTGEDAAGLITLFGTQPDLVNTALKTLVGAQNPNSVVKCALLVGGKSTEEMGDRADYGARLIEASASYDAGAIDELGDYLKAGKHFAGEIKLGGDATNAGKTKARTGYVGSALLQDGGEMDFAKGHAAIMDVMFHPSAMDFQTPQQANHMRKTLDFLEADNEAQKLLRQTKAPESPAARGLLTRGSDKQPQKLEQGDVQQAIVNAMLTPVYQGKIGSCFSTSGVVRMRETEPLATMKMYEELATKGTFSSTLPGVDPVHAIVNVPIDEDPLVRSLEYTLATAGARLADARETLNSGISATNVVEKMGDQFNVKRWIATRERLTLAIARAFTLTYDPEIKVDVATDGSSDRGRMVLVDKKNSTQINDEKAWKAVIERVLNAEISDLDLNKGVKKSAVIELMKSPEVMEASKVNGLFPWELVSGGFADTTTSVMTGKKVAKQPKIPAAKPEEIDIAERSKAALKMVLADYGKADGAMAEVTTSGMHSFNVLPANDTLLPLRDSGGNDVDAAIEAALLKPGRKIAKTPLPVEQVVYMFEREMDRLIAINSAAARKALEDARKTNAPTGAMTPGELTSHIAKITKPITDTKAKVAADTWKQKETDKNKKEPTEQAYEAELKKRTEAEADLAYSGLADAMIADLGAPVFVIADTNWGGGDVRSSFVIAADPATGQPQLFIRQDPPGRLKIMDDQRKWLASEWQRQ